MKHHFLPQFYLSGFTLKGRNNDALWVLDQQNRKQWKSTPTKSGHRRDYYRVEINDGHDPNSIETTFADLESKASGVIRRIIEKAEIPDEERDFDILMNFVALMAVRVPGARDALSNADRTRAKMILQGSVASRDIWDATMARLTAKSKLVDASASYEEMRDFILGDELEIAISQNAELRSMLMAFEIILKTLGARKWGLLLPNADAPDIICSDRPVSLTWLRDPPPLLSWRQPGFATPHSLLIFPISRRIALAGLLEGDLCPELDPKGVANINSLIGACSTQFLYSAENDFCWLRSDGEICGRDELLAALRDASASSQE